MKRIKIDHYDRYGDSKPCYYCDGKARHVGGCPLVELAVEADEKTRLEREQALSGLADRVSPPEEPLRIDDWSEQTPALDLRCFTHNIYNCEVCS